MKKIKAAVVVAAVGTLAFMSAHAQTPDSVQARIDTLTFERGYLYTSS
jgi:hypothetical protein